MKYNYLAVVSDDRFGSVAEELAVLQPLGVELRVASCHTPVDVVDACAVIFTDHCGYRSERSIKELKTRCAENAARGLGLLP